MQAPGGPEEDPTGGFSHGGWSAALWDQGTQAAMAELFAEPVDLLLGRFTYDIFAAHWPYVETDPSAGSFEQLNADIAQLFNRMTKYVATHRPDTLTWQNTEWLGEDVVAKVRELQACEGPHPARPGLQRTPANPPGRRPPRRDPPPHLPAGARDAENASSAKARSRPPSASRARPPPPTACC
jgi:hypothetical protein